MMKLLNTKTLLVIAALLAIIAGILTRQELRTQKAEQEKVAAQKQTDDFWQQVEAERKKAPQHRIQNLDEHGQVRNPLQY